MENLTFVEILKKKMGELNSTGEKLKYISNRYVGSEIYDLYMEYDNLYEEFINELLRFDLVNFDYEYPKYLKIRKMSLKLIGKIK